MSPADCKRFRESLPGTLRTVVGFGQLFGVSHGTVYRWENEGDATRVPGYVDSVRALVQHVGGSDSVLACDALHVAHLAALGAASASANAAQLDGRTIHPAPRTDGQA